MTLPVLGGPGRVVCQRCGQAKPASAFYRIDNPHDERAQPCKACRQHPPPELVPAPAAPDRAADRADEAAEAAAPLVAQAWELCAQAGLDLPAGLLTDAYDCLTYGDFARPAATPAAAAGAGPAPAARTVIPSRDGSGASPAPTRRRPAVTGVQVAWLVLAIGQAALAGLVWLQHRDGQARRPAPTRWRGDVTGRRTTDAAGLSPHAPNGTGLRPSRRRRGAS